MPELIKHAVLVETHPDYKDHEGVNQVHLFYAAMRLNGAIHAVKLTVKEHEGKSLGLEAANVHRLYDQQIEKSMPGGNYTAPSPEGPAPYSTPGTDTLTIQELLEGVNDVAGRPYFAALQELFQDAFEDPAATFYSQLERTIEAKLPGKGTAKQYIATIEAWAKKGMFKPEVSKIVGGQAQGDTGRPNCGGGGQGIAAIVAN